MVNGYHNYGFGAATDPDAQWQQLGWPSKTAYHQAGRPGIPYSEYRTAHAATTTTPAVVAEDVQWRALGWPTKQTYHQAGRPGISYTSWLALQTSQTTSGPGTPPNCNPGYAVEQQTGTPGNMSIAIAPRCVPVTSGAGGGSGTGIPADESSSGGLGDLFSGIPKTYLLIGGAVVVFMLVKKR